MVAESRNPEEVKERKFRMYQWLLSTIGAARQFDPTPLAFQASQEIERELRELMMQSLQARAEPQVVNFSKKKEENV